MEMVGVPAGGGSGRWRDRDGDAGGPSGRGEGRERPEGGETRDHRTHATGRALRPSEEKVGRGQQRTNRQGAERTRGNGCARACQCFQMLLRCTVGSHR